MVVSEAKLQFMTNLSPKDDIQLIENTTNTFKNLCHRISTYTNVTRCKSFQKIVKEDEMFTIRRIKRSHGLLGAIKSLLIGSDTSEEVEALSHAQTQTKILLTKTLQHINQSETIISTNLNIIAATLEATNDQLKQMEQYETKLNETLLKLQVIELFETTTSILRTMEHRYVLTADTDIISKQEFHVALNNLRVHMVDETIIGDEKEDFDYKIIMLNDKVVIQFKIPVTSNTNYDIIKVNPVPELGYVVDVLPQYVILNYSYINERFE